MNRRGLTGIFGVLTIFTLIFCFSGSSFFSFFRTVFAAVPNIVSYQGRLEDTSGNPLGSLSGTNYNFKFSIWDTPSVATGTRLWPASPPGAVTLPVMNNGVFDARLGDTSEGFTPLTLDFNTSTIYYLQIEVYNSATVSYETLSPRQSIVSAGFAINASTLNGFAQGTSSNNLLQLDSSGNINLPGGQIRTINNSSCSTLLAIGGGALCYDTTNSNLFVFNSASSTWVSLGGASSSGNSTLQQVYNLGSNINTVSGKDFVVNIVSSTAGSFLVQASSSNSLAVTFSTISLNLPTTISSTLTVSGGASLQGFSFTNATGTALNVTTASTTGLYFLNATSTGNLQVGTFIATSVSSTGITFLNATSTGNFQVGTLLATNASSTGITFLNATSTGNISVGTASTTGLTFLNATSTGNLQVGTLLATTVSSS
jgi:hypothetical protein